MKNIRINLKSFYADILPNDVYLDSFLYDESFEFPHEIRRSILVLPGGGYEFISYREKDPIMFAFNALGYQSFSLSYSCHTLYPVPHLELMCALHYLNTHHEELGIIPKQITLIGFSAGGHLAASYAGVYQKLNRFNDSSLIKPFALVLAYPVISLIKSDNPQCIKNITNFDDELRHLLSADEQVSNEYPPTFMWTCKTDQMVNPENVSWLKKALDKKKVKNKCMIYSSGGHGLALANHATWCHNPDWINNEASKWPELAHQFIQKL